jgi:hypothetical protein
VAFENGHTAPSLRPLVLDTAGSMQLNLSIVSNTIDITKDVTPRQQLFIGSLLDFLHILLADVWIWPVCD